MRSAAELSEQARPKAKPFAVARSLSSPCTRPPASAASKPPARTSKREHRTSIAQSTHGTPSPHRMHTRLHASTPARTPTVPRRTHARSPPPPTHLCLRTRIRKPTRKYATSNNSGKWQSLIVNLGVVVQGRWAWANGPALPRLCCFGSAAAGIPIDVPSPPPRPSGPIASIVLVAHQAHHQTLSAHSAIAPALSRRQCLALY